MVSRVEGSGKGKPITEDTKGDGAAVPGATDGELIPMVAGPGMQVGEGAGLVRLVAGPGVEVGEGAGLVPVVAGPGLEVRKGGGLVPMVSGPAGLGDIDVEGAGLGLVGSWQ